MSDITITPAALTGSVTVPSSKSMGHRALICAALAAGESRVEQVSVSRDITATKRCLEALGAVITEQPDAAGRVAFTVKGCRPHQHSPLMECGESGSTLRFLIPLAAIDGNCYNFNGEGELGSRPLDPYEKIFAGQGLLFHYGSQRHFPLSVQGPLHGGSFTLPGNVSSQFISGLLFALPLLPEDSAVTITGPYESQSYVNLTLSALKAFGIRVSHEGPAVYRIPGGQTYKPCSGPVEGDFSQAAFWLVAGALGKKLLVRGTRMDSLQGDRAIVPILQRMGGRLTRTEDGILSGQFGVFFCGTANWQMWANASEDPDFRLVAFHDPVRKAGDTNHLRAENFLVTQGGVGISTTCAYPEEAAKLIDYCFSEEGRFLLSFGTEGKTFEYDDQGHPQYTDLITANPDGLNQTAAMAIYVSFGISSIEHPDTAYLVTTNTPDQDAAAGIWTETSDNAYGIPNVISMTVDESAENASLLSDVGTYVSTWMVKAIMGDQPLTPEAIQEFRDTMEGQLQIGTCIANKQAALDRYLSR